LDAAAKQETTIRQNIEVLQAVLKEASTNSKQQLDAVKALEASQRVFIKELLDEHKGYSKRVATLLAVLLVAVCGIGLFVLITLLTKG
jgi:transcriptional regulator with PAS, ATPase and Fis domain